MTPTQLLVSICLLLGIALGTGNAGPEFVATAREDIAIRFNAEGAELLAHAQFPEAETRFLMAQAACGECRALAPILNNLGSVYLRNKSLGTDRLKKAIEFYRRALVIRETQDGSESLALLTVLNNLTLAYGDLADNSSALGIARRAWKLVQENDSTETMEGANVESRLGNLLLSLGELSEARKLLSLALQTREKLLGPNDVLVASSLNDLSVAASHAGRLKEAGELAMKAVAILTATRGQDTSALPSVLNNLGRVRMAQGRTKDGEYYFGAAIGEAEKRFGLGDPAVSIGLTNLAGLLGARGKYEEAERLLDRAMEIDAIAFPAFSDRMAYDLSTAGTVAFKHKDFSRAEELFRRALEIVDQSVPRNPLDSGRISANLGEVYLKQNRIEEAGNAFAAAIQSFNPAAGDAELLPVLVRYASTLRTQQRFAEAAGIDARAMKIRVQAALRASD
jgi:tetratricopeptide (TPR) repeat protein